HGRGIGDVAGHRLHARIVEARAARFGDVEQQQLVHFRGTAVGPGQRALLQDAPGQLLAEEAAAAGDHHLHRPHPCCRSSQKVCTDRASASMLSPMAAVADIHVFKDALLVLVTAAVIAPIMPRLRVSPVLGYLAVGATLGPYGLGRFARNSPVIDWLTVTGEPQIGFIGDLGIVFLLFFIGLELSLRRLITLRRLVFGLGGLQVALTTAAISGVALWLGQPPAAALVIGACLALSSAQRRLTSTTGRTSFAILLAQDLAVIPLLLLVGALGGATAGPLWLGI